MTPILVIIVLVGFFLIATEKLSGINRAAVAVFIGTLCWVLYVGYGSSYVMSQHSGDYFSFLHGATANSTAAKHYIARNVFVPWVGRAAEIVLFLLTTMTIVEILQNNGCFDFFRRLLRTRNSKRILWTLTAITFILSANIDNLTTTIMMLTVMHQLVPQHRQRVVLGSAIVVAANCGGALTVIGDATGLFLWTNNHINATNYSLSMAVPCLLACILTVAWIGRKLPENIQTERMTMPYRGNDTNLSVIQRLLMLILGIGGLWFIPTFHNITKLSPFLGAMCVLSILWIVNEIFNRKLLSSGMMSRMLTPQAVKYGSIQSILFICGMMLAIAAVVETGFPDRVAQWVAPYINNVWTAGLAAGAASTVLDGFATSLACFSVDSIPQLQSCYVEDGSYWKVIAYATAVGGNVLAIGSISGLVLLKMERISVGWYFVNVGWKALVCALVGFASLWFFV